MIFGPSALGIWGASIGGPLRRRIGWQRYWRYLVILATLGLVNVIDGVIFTVVGELDYVVDTILLILTSIAALFVPFSLSSAGIRVRDTITLGLSDTWRDCASIWRQALGLAIVWTILKNVIAFIGQIMALTVQAPLRFGARGETDLSIWSFYIWGEGAATLMIGLFTFYSGLVTLALFWRLAVPTPQKAPLQR